MNFSCPIWAPVAVSSRPSGKIVGSGSHNGCVPLREPESLFTAQTRKLVHLIIKARIKESDHILEIGTGSGNFALLVTKLTGCRVTSITFSKQQKEYVEKCIKEARLQSKITVLLQNYQSAEFMEHGEKFDKIISIEALSSVGENHLVPFFRRVDSLLKEDGIAVFQCITIPDKVIFPVRLRWQSINLI